METGSPNLACGPESASPYSTSGWRTLLLGLLHTHGFDTTLWAQPGIQSLDGQSLLGDSGMTVQATPNHAKSPGHLPTRAI